MNYEIYEGRTDRNRKKTYLVFNLKTDIFDVFAEAAKHFKCAHNHILIEDGWTFRENLYFENPRKKGTQKVRVGYWI